jgi:hypothetical protein
MAFAVGALLADLAYLLLPVNSGSSLVSLAALQRGYPLRVQVASLLMLFSQALAILIGIMLLRRGREAMASGVFIGLLVVLGLRLVYLVMLTIDGFTWQAVILLGLQTIECALLFLAARAAQHQGTPA